MYIIHCFAPQTNPCNTIDVLKAQQSYGSSKCRRSR